MVVRTAGPFLGQRLPHLLQFLLAGREGRQQRASGSTTASSTTGRPAAGAASHAAPTPAGSSTPDAPQAEQPACPA
jgi:hypothetical protein